MGLTWSPRNSANDADRRPDLDRTVATGVRYGAAAQCAGISPARARGGPTRVCGSIPAQLGSLITTGSLELFSRRPGNLDLPEDAILTPIPVDDDIISLSAILLDEGYFEALQAAKRQIDGITIIDEILLIPFKARAFLDLTARLEAGGNVDRKDIKKHRNDVFRLAQLLPLDASVDLPESVRLDLRTFVDSGGSAWPALLWTLRSSATAGGTRGTGRLGRAVCAPTRSRASTRGNSSPTWCSTSCHDVMTRTVSQPAGLFARWNGARWDCGSIWCYANPIMYTLLGGEDVDRHRLRRRPRGRRSRRRVMRCCRPRSRTGLRARGLGAEFFGNGQTGRRGRAALRTVDKTVPTLAAGASAAAQPAQQSSDHPRARLWQSTI